MEYNELIKEIEQNLNNSSVNLEKLKSNLTQIKELFGIELSREFLRGMIKGTDRQVTNKLYYALRGLDFNKPSNKYKHYLDFVKYEVEIIEYSCHNGIINQEIRKQTIGKDKIRNEKKVYHFL